MNHDARISALEENGGNGGSQNGKKKVFANVKKPLISQIDLNSFKTIGTHSAIKIPILNNCISFSFRHHCFSFGFHFKWYDPEFFTSDIQYSYIERSRWVCLS